MNDALKIMDEIEHHHKLRPVSWRKLRAVIERQAEELAQSKVRERLLSQSLENAKPEVRRELAVQMRQKDAQIARLEESLSLLQEATLQTYRAGRVEALGDVLEMIDPDERGEDAIRHIENLIDRIEQEVNEND